MTFRRKLLIVFALTVFLSVAAVAGLVSTITRRAFDKSENDRTAALVTQFQREFERRGNEVEQRVETVTAGGLQQRIGCVWCGELLLCKLNREWLSVQRAQALQRPEEGALF